MTNTPQQNNNSQPPMNNEDIANSFLNTMPPAPPGDEYILKSQIVPPVCPACPKCPPVKVCPKTGSLDSDSCPPCPACARCPEPAFECKKVPNYRSNGLNGYLPKPILNNFSEF